MELERSEPRPGPAADSSEDSPTPYVGPDRRTGGEPRSPFGRPFVTAGLLLIGLWLLVSILSARGWELPAWLDVQALNALLTSAAAVVTLGVAIVFTMRWRLVGETASLRAGVAVGVLALAVYAVPELSPLVVEGSETSTTVSAVHAAGVMVAAALLWLAVKLPEVDTRVRLRGLLVRTAGAVAVLAALLAIRASVPRLFGSPVSAPQIDASGGEIVGGALVGVVWLGLAVVYWRVGIRRERWLHTWLGLMLLGLALATLASASVQDRGEIWLTGSAGLQVAAALLAAYGAAEELRSAWVQQQDRLFRVQSEFEVERLRHALEEARRQEQVHDARSAILAIHGAALGLEQSADDLDDGERATLARALTAEIERLQQLVEGAPKGDAPSAFAVRHAIEPVVTCYRSGDLGLTVEIPDGLQAIGRPHELAEVVQNLLDNAGCHAPGSPIRVSAAREGDNVVLRVEDRGPGVEPHEREAIFERGRKGAHGSTAGTGLGLHVSRRLMREQGGDLWVEGRPGGGATFVLFLPAAESVSPGRPDAEAPPHRLEASHPVADSAARN